MRFWNKYTLIGTVLFIVGIPLTVIWIGVPIMMIGFFVADIGVVYYIVKMIPGLDKKISSFINVIKNSYKPYFKKEVRVK